MKQILTIIICLTLFSVACNQSNTTPTTPPANSCGNSTNSNEFIELKINGLTLKSESINISNGLGGFFTFPVMATFITDTSSERRLSLLGSTTICPSNSTMINNMAITVFASKKSSNYIDPIGVYNKAAYGNISYYKNLSDVKGYTIPDDSITLNVTSCTADYVSGTFVGHALENNTNILYPFNGTFNNLKRSGF